MARKVTAKDHLKNALKCYREESGASRMSSYRDVVTDILHLAFNDKELRKEWKVPDKGAAANANWDANIKAYVIDNGYSGFEEEREQAEYDFMYGIKNDDLPLYVNHEWEFMGKEYLTRLKDAKDVRYK